MQAEQFKSAEFGVATIAPAEEEMNADANNKP